MSDKHSLEFNKLAAGFLLAGILAMVSAFTADYLYNGSGSHGGEEKRGYSVEVPEEGASGALVATVEEADIMELLAVADAINGAKEAGKRCASCHTFDAGGAHKTGPNLFGIIGKKHAAKAGFPYSKAIQAVPGVYDYESMNKWLQNPQKVAKGSKMVLKVKKDATRADIIKYLDTLR